MVAEKLNDKIARGKQGIASQMSLPSVLNTTTAAINTSTPSLLMPNIRSRQFIATNETDNRDVSFIVPQTTFLMRHFSEPHQPSISHSMTPFSSNSSLPGYENQKLNLNLSFSEDVLASAVNGQHSGSLSRVQTPQQHAHSLASEQWPVTFNQNM